MDVIVIFSSLPSAVPIYFHFLLINIHWCFREHTQVMFVPHGYWHMVVNLDACVALTHNYVSTSNLSDCLQFLREKKEQISGLRDRLGQGAVPPERLYDCFVEKLADKIGADKLTQYIQESFKG